MATFELTEAADRDLTGIYIYTYRQFGEPQADAYLAALDECCQRLAEMPRLGRAIDHIRTGYFRFEHGRHVVFYTTTVRGIRVVRVLHERMEPDRHL